jgi:hypothetical protein
MTRIINCYNQYHLGDCIEALHFLINAARCNDVKFNFLCNRDYHSQLKEFIGDANGKLYSITPPDIVDNTFINTWIGAYNYGQICEDSDVIFGEDSDQGTFFLVLSKILSDIMELKCPFTEKADMIYNESSLESSWITSFDSYDYLFINSPNMSIPFPNFEEEVSIFIERLQSKNKKVITTAKYLDLPCTLDYNFSIVDIAKLSKNVKNVVGVNTGPLHLCMNKWTIQNVQSFTVWSPAETFNYGSKFRSVKSLGEIDASNI